MSAKDADAEETVELGVYLGWVKSELDNESACLELPKTIILLMSFSILAIMHLKQDKVFSIEEAIRFDIEENANFAWSHNFGHKTVFDVNSIADFWSWFNLGYLPLVVQLSWGYSESLQDAYDAMNGSYSAAKLPGLWRFGENGSKPLPVRSDYLHYNRIIGGIRLRQEVASRGWDLCRVPGSVPEDLWKAWLGKPCMPASPAYQFTPESPDAENFREPTRIEWFLTANESLEEMQNKVADMEDGCAQLEEKGRPGACLCATCVKDDGIVSPWLDEQTQRIEIGFVSYNAEYGLLSLSTVNFFFSRGGRIHKFVFCQSVWLNQYAGYYMEVGIMVLCDAVWMFILTQVFFSEVLEMVAVVRASTARWYKSIWQDYVAFWNTVDWISIAVAYLVFAFYLQLFFATNDVNKAFEHFVERQEWAVLGRNESLQMSTEFFDLVEQACAKERTYRTSFCFYPFVVMMRLFKSFDAQPRLAVVTRTIKDAAQDMLHFGIIFSSVFFCLCVNSVLLFGQDVEDFATLDRAVIHCFLFMFGDWDWGSMQEVQLLLAAMWFWVFILLIVIILLNMLLAILMDSYSVVKSETSEMKSLPAQITDMLRRRRQNRRKERVKLNAIWEHWWVAMKEDLAMEKEMLDSKRLIAPSDILATVPGIPKSQAKRTWTNAKKDDEKRKQDPFTEDTLLDKLERLNNRCVAMRNRSRNARQRLEQCVTEDTQWDSNVTENPPDACTEPKVQIVDAMRGVLGQLSNQISGVVSEELQFYAGRHRELDSQQRKMLACANDSHHALQQLRSQMDAVQQRLRQQAQIQRRRNTAAAIASETGGFRAARGLAACTPCAKPVPATRVYTS